MQSVADLHIESFDECVHFSSPCHQWMTQPFITLCSFIVKDSRVAVRYTAAGTHCGSPHRGIPASGKHARWTACCIFHLNNLPKITHMRKEWDKLAMWHQLGWCNTSPADLT